MRQGRGQDTLGLGVVGETLQKVTRLKVETLQRKEGGDTPGYTPTYTPRSGETPSNTPSYGPDEGDTPSLTPTYTPEGGGQTPSDTPVHAPSEGSSFAPKHQDEAILSGEIGLPCSGQIPLECSTSPVIENHEAADDFQQSSEVIPDASSRTPEDVDRSKGSP